MGKIFRVITNSNLEGAQRKNMWSTSKKEKYIAELVNKINIYAEKNGVVKFSRPLRNWEMVQLVCLKFAHRAKNPIRRDENGARY